MARLCFIESRVPLTVKMPTSIIDGKNVRKCVLELMEYFEIGSQLVSPHQNSKKNFYYCKKNGSATIFLFCQNLF